MHAIYYFLPHKVFSMQVLIKHHVEKKYLHIADNQLIDLQLTWEVVETFFSGSFFHFFQRFEKKKKKKKLFSEFTLNKH